MFSDIKTFSLFLFGDPNTSEDSSNDLPGDIAGHNRPDRIGSGAERLNTELFDATPDKQAQRRAVALDVKAPEANNKCSPNAADSMDREGSNRIIDSCGIER